MNKHKIIKPYVRIPLFLIELILKETKRINMLRLYLFLNSRSNGHIRFSHGDRTAIANKLGLKRQSVTNNLKLLLERNWIGYNSDKDLYHIRGFRTIKRLEGCKGRIAIEINVETELNDRVLFEGLIWAAYIGNFIKSQDRKAERKQREECQKGGSKHKRRGRRPFRPVAISVLSKCLNISRSTACDGRKLALQYKYLEFKRPLRPIPSYEAEERYNAGGKEADVVRCFQGSFFVQETMVLRTTKSLSYCRISREAKKPKNRQKYLFDHKNSDQSTLSTSYLINEPIPF